MTVMPAGSNKMLIAKENDMPGVAGKISRRSILAGSMGAAFLGMASRTGLAQADPLPSWNDGATKKSITDFVARVTTQGGADFVPIAERIATFDNDGTLWCEHPIYFQAAFAMDRVKALAPKHPEWKDKAPFKALIDGDMKAVAAAGEKGLVAFVAASHSGMSVDDFHRIVLDWLDTARHPRFKRPYTSLVYQPMLELLAYLRGNDFKTFIVSGGGIDFMRPWTDKVYGIPPEQVVGSSGVTKFEMVGGKPVLMKTAEVEFVDDGPGKPVGINRFIGRRPIFAFGNSDGDLQMLQWTAAGNQGRLRPAFDGAMGARFMGIVHHTDSEREYAYDRQTHVGRLDKALDEGRARGWTFADMKRDWRVIFPVALASGSR
jgi:phosphoglycolate phosphatase-like HAD superfamily hydrolase